MDTQHSKVPTTTVLCFKEIMIMLKETDVLEDGNQMNMFQMLQHG
jgi:hypothetical protein